MKCLLEEVDEIATILGHNQSAQQVQKGSDVIRIDALYCLFFCCANERWALWRACRRVFAKTTVFTYYLRGLSILNSLMKSRLATLLKGLFRFHYVAYVKSRTVKAEWFIIPFVCNDLAPITLSLGFVLGLI